MKKFLIALSIVLFMVIWYLLYTLKEVNDKMLTLSAWDNDAISQIEKELSIKVEELSGLQTENQQLRDTLSWTIETLNSLQVEKLKVEKSLSWCEYRLTKYIEYINKLGEKNSSNKWNSTTNVSNNSTSNGNTTIKYSEENWRIQQVYTDKNWNKKIDIVYGWSMVGWDECGDPAAAVCFKVDNPKVGTFKVSDNVQIIMQTLSHTSEGYFNNGQVINFDFFEQKFNDTNNYDEYPHNYSYHFKQLVYRITIENDIVVKIEEQYMP